MTQRTRKRHRRFAKVERRLQRKELDRQIRLSNIMKARKAVYED